MTHLENSEEIMKEHIIIGYHENCPDGMAAAAVAWGHFGGRAIYCGLSYGQPLHPALEAAQEDAEVYLLDFHYEPPDLADLGRRVRRLVVLDHHRTFHDAATAWELQHGPLPLERWGEDCAEAGCVLAWRFWRPEMDVPRMLRYVQDRDLWRWALTDSREFSAWLSSQPMVIELWYQWLSELDDPLAFREVRDRGRAILGHVRMIVGKQALAARPGWLQPPMVEPVQAMIVNATAYVDEVGERVLEEAAVLGLPLVAVWREAGDGRRKWSLRSTPDFDCSAVAKAFPGGGGHRQAAGFTTRATVEFV